MSVNIKASSAKVASRKFRKAHPKLVPTKVRKAYSMTKRRGIIKGTNAYTVSFKQRRRK